MEHEDDGTLPVLVAAGVLVRNGRHVLLQKRGDDGSWGLPGGALNPGETLEQAARRELLEETGLVAGELVLVDVYSGPEFVVSYPDGFSAYVVGATYEATETTGTLTADGGETLALEWFDRDDVTVPVNPFNQHLLRRVGLELGSG
ncbi:NUDIX domain-containing protein [Nocardioides lijunqiniae]|uniref:NUDIX domain-containing protein n=1 Tax=Nocardioides lijunqiniae TaxID=2760832 RepID=UPI0030B816AE